MKRSPLHEHHAKHGARFTEMAGWEVPAHYGDPLAEHRAVRQSVGIADLSQRGKCRITGEDRTKWLQSLISNDILPLPTGQGLYSSFLTHKGKMLTYFRVFALSDALMLEDVGNLGDTTFQSLRKFLLYGTKAKIENCAETWGLILISGPQSPALLQSAWGLDVASLKPLAVLQHEIAGQPALIFRSEETGEIDIEMLLPASTLIEAWNRLWQVGDAFGLQPFGAEAHEMLRLEAGLPLAGQELTDEIVPPEANLEGKAFSLNKGCYPGQEVVARMDTYGSVRRRLSGLALPNAVIPLKGTKLFSGDREVGWISSAAHSPSLGYPIAFGCPLRDFREPGTKLAIEVNGKRHSATVRSLPFYSSRN